LLCSPKLQLDSGHHTHTQVSTGTEYVTYQGQPYQLPDAWSGGIWPAYNYTTQLQVQDQRQTVDISSGSAELFGHQSASSSSQGWAALSWSTSKSVSYRSETLEDFVTITHGDLYRVQSKAIDEISTTVYQSAAQAFLEQEPASASQGQGYLPTYTVAYRSHTEGQLNLGGYQLSDGAADVAVGSGAIVFAGAGHQRITSGYFAGRAAYLQAGSDGSYLQGANVLVSGAGDDTLVDGSTMVLGEGRDTAIATGATTIYVRASSGVDTIVNASASDRLQSSYQQGQYLDAIYIGMGYPDWARQLSDPQTYGFLPVLYRMPALGVEHSPEASALYAAQGIAVVDISPTDPLAIKPLAEYLPQSFVQEQLTIELDPAILRAEISASWGQITDPASGQLRASLQLRWGGSSVNGADAQGLNLVMPSSTSWPPVSQTQIKLGDGVILPMADLMALAGPAPDFDVSFFKVQRGMGQVQLDSMTSPGLRLEGLSLQDVFISRQAGAGLYSLSMRIKGTDDTLLISHWDEFAALQALRLGDGSLLGYRDLLALVNQNSHAPELITPVADQAISDIAAWSLSLANRFSDGDTARGDQLSQRVVLIQRTTDEFGWVNEEEVPLPSWLSFDAATGQLQMARGQGIAGQYSLRVYAQDSSGLAAWDDFDLTVTHADSPPVLSAPLADQAARQAQPFSLVIPQEMFTDADAGDVLTLSVRLAGGAALPSWLRFDAATRTLQGTARNREAGVTLALEITATDSTGQSASQTVQLTVAETAGLTLTGTSARNTLTGGGGDDLIDGLAGADRMIGADGDDTYTVDNTGDVIVELFDEGYDTVRSSISYVLPEHVEAITLLGTGGLRATGNGAANLLIGNAGSNRLDGGAGADVMRGGAGNDTYVVDDLGDSVEEALAEGTDTVQSSVDWSLSANVEHLTLTGSQALHGQGNELANTITGNAARNWLEGLAGNDTLLGGEETDWLDGGEGADKLDGGLGADVMLGGAGNDTYIVSSSRDIVLEAANEGTDTVQSSVDHWLSTHVENLTLTGSAIKGVGNALANVLTGNALSNSLFGLGGNDTLKGGDSADWLDGGEGADKLDAGAGNDFLVGGKGNDTITSGAGQDVIAFNRGDGSDSVAASTGDADVLSLGGGIRYADLKLRKSGNDLILETGAAVSGGTTEQITIKGWYADATGASRSISKLQIVTAASTDFNAASSDALLSSAVAVFDLQALAAQFDAARTATPSLTRWSLNANNSSALRTSLLGTSNTQAIGGDLAYDYAMQAATDGINGSNLHTGYAGMASAQVQQSLTAMGDAWQTRQTTALPIVNPWIALEAGTALILGQPVGLAQMQPLAMQPNQDGGLGQGALLSQQPQTAATLYNGSYTGLRPMGW
jgi:Ca2+-binding RTX toxin-like protein